MYCLIFHLIKKINLLKAEKLLNNKHRRNENMKLSQNYSSYETDFTFALRKENKNIREELKR